MQSRVTRLGAVLFVVAMALGACGKSKVAGVCAKACTTTVDCCPSGTVNCPGNYPNNYECTAEGLCKAPHCVTNADCTALAGPTNATLVCTASHGLIGCFAACTVDNDCTLPSARCNGFSDDKQMICGSFDCRQGGVLCLGPLSCLPDGRCGCTKDSDCGTSGKVHCIGGTCGCGDNADCQPKLDVCSDDGAYRYPPAATTTTTNP